jgi:hypothetical protein
MVGSREERSRKRSEEYFGGGEEDDGVRCCIAMYFDINETY